MFLSMARGMCEHQVPQLVILVLAISMMQFDFLFDLDHLPTARTESVLLSQELSTKRRRCLQRQFAVAVVEIRLPSRIKGVGCALDLEIALRFDRLPHSKQLLAGSRIGKLPRFSLAVRKVAVGNPAPALVRVPALGPADRKSVV